MLRRRRKKPPKRGGRLAAIRAAGRAPEGPIHCEAVPVEWIAAADGDGGEDEAKPFSMVAYTGGPMKLSGWFDPVVVDLTGLRAAGEEIPALLAHDRRAIVGHGTPEITAQRVKMAGVVSGGGVAAEEVRVSARRGFPWRASIGAEPQKAEYVDRGATAKANGRVFKGPVVIIRAAELKEISFVPIAADGRTRAAVAASQPRRTENMDPELRKWLEAKGFSPDELSDEQLAPLEAQWKAEQADPGDGDVERSAPPSGRSAPKNTPPPLPVEAAGDGGSVPLEGDLADYRRRLAAETRRASDVQAAAAAYSGRIEPKKLATIQASAIEEGWSEDKLELELMRSARPTGPAVHAQDPGELSERVVEAAACQTLGLEAVEKEFDEKTLEAADRRFHRELGLQELFLLAAARNGYRGRQRITNGNVREVLRYAMPERPIEAAGEWTGFSLSGILGATANKFLLEAFYYVESTWRRIARIGSVGNFHTHTHYRLTGDFSYEKLGPNGEIQHATADEDSYTISADTYARMMGIDRRDLINDDLGALSAVPRKLGRGAALKINKVFWTALLANTGNFFHANNSNYVAGAAYALSSAGLKKAVETFRKMTDADGDPIGVNPRLVLCPPEVEETAWELYKSTNLVGDSTGKNAAKNIYAGRYEPVVSAYLSNTAYTGYSTTAWYLLADPRDVAVIELVFLNGQQRPVVESAEADFNVLGVLYRGYLDFGVALADEEGGVKMKGAA